MAPNRHAKAASSPAFVPLLAAGLLAATVASVLSEPGQVAVALAACVICCLVIARTEWGLLLLVLIVYTNFSDVASEFHGAPSITKVFAPALLVLAAYKGLVLGERMGRLAPATLGLLAAYGFSMVLSVYNAEVPSLLFAAFADFLKDALLALTIVLLLTRARTLRGVVWMLILGGCFLSAINGYQYLTGAYDQNFGGFSRLAVSENVGAPDWIRVTGPMDDPNSYAQILLIVVPLALERLWNEHNWLVRLLALAALVLVINAIMLTYSRGAIVALTVMIAMVLPIMRVRLSWIVGVSAMLATFLSLAPSNYTERMRTIVDAFGNADRNQAPVDDAVGGRVAEMQIAWQMFKDHPVLGVGEDHYQDRFQQYSVLLNGPPRGESRKAHSLYLEIAAERGVVGLIMFGVLLFCLGRHIWRSHTTFAKAGQLHYAQMVLALGVGFAGYLAAAVFLHESYAHYFWMMVGLALAVPQVAAEETNVAVPDDVVPRPVTKWPDAVTEATLQGGA